MNEKIDFFSDGPNTIYEDYEIAIDPATGCRCDIPVRPVTIASYDELAKRVFHHNDVECLVDKKLQESQAFQQWRRSMPSVTPKSIAVYQKTYKVADLKLVDIDVRKYGLKLPIGQVLFHGGNLRSGILTRPLSLTFCPQVARQEALWGGKASAHGFLGIYKITIVGNMAVGFALRQRGTSLGNEKEILVASGIDLQIGPVLYEESINGLQWRIFDARLGGNPMEICPRPHNACK